MEAMPSLRLSHSALTGAAGAAHIGELGEIVADALLRHDIAQQEIRCVPGKSPASSRPRSAMLLM